MTVTLPSGHSLYHGQISGILNEYAQTQEDFIGMKIFTPVPTDAETDYFWRVAEGELTKTPESLRAPGTKYNREGLALTQDSYATRERGLESPVDDRKSKTLERFFSLRETLAKIRALEIMRATEIEIRDAVLNATNFPTGGTFGLNVSNNWTSIANGTPISDIIAGKEAIVGKTGLEPDTLVVSYKVYLYLFLNAQVREALGIKYQAESLGATFPIELLANHLGLKRILFSKLKYNSTPNNPTATLTSIWTDTQAFLCKAGETTDLTEMCVGRTISWEPDGGLFAAEEYRDETVRGNVVRARNDTAIKLISADCGFRFTNVAA